ncbi:toll/interleukin-1 receptor domain-containing protein [Variovorax sp. dw_954]|uniref:toll/interleukin-1 receptor domain-containing protein n=1 Tax=Variovorax sp. dw_954 TaxID=2720078 RepID=UPI001BD1C3C2|nr:toll/interleukin-1 receptor domain-containing protein [Variovorax sp. dw_954]
MNPTSIFLSHNREDKEFVRRLADDLRRAGVIAWVDEAEIRIGDSIIGKIEDGILGSEYLGVVLSPNSVASQWVKEELRAVLHYQVTKKSKTILPLLYRSCDIPPFLVDKLYADFTDPTQYEFVLRQLLSRLDSTFEPPAFVSRADLQHLLDMLPLPAKRGSIMREPDENDVDYVSSNAFDLSELGGLVSWPSTKLASALRELLAANKVELFLFKGEISNNDHPKIPAGTKFVLPMVFRGLLPPNLRSKDAEIESILRSIEAR